MLGLSLIPLVPILVLLAVLATDVWVYGDAKAHEQRGTPVVVSIGSLQVDAPAAWFLGCLILWVLCFPLYIRERNQVG
jgi:hypothetical protein